MVLEHKTRGSAPKRENKKPKYESKDHILEDFDALTFNYTVQMIPMTKNREITSTLVRVIKVNECKSDLLQPYFIFISTCYLHSLSN